MGLASTAKEKMVCLVVKISRVDESVKLEWNCVNAVFKGQGRETSDEYSIFRKNEIVFDLWRIVLIRYSRSRVEKPQMSLASLGR